MHVVDTCEHEERIARALTTHAGGRLGRGHSDWAIVHVSVVAPTSHRVGLDGARGGVAGRGGDGRSRGGDPLFDDHCSGAARRARERVGRLVVPDIGDRAGVTGAH